MLLCLFNQQIVIRPAKSERLDEGYDEDEDSARKQVDNKPLSIDGEGVPFRSMPARSDTDTTADTGGNAEMQSHTPAHNINFNKVSLESTTESDTTTTEDLNFPQFPDEET